MSEYIAEDLFDECGSLIGVQDHGELIRCKDCVYFSSEKSGAKWNMCRFHDSPKKENGFCDDAERKEE